MNSFQEYIFLKKFRKLISKEIKSFHFSRRFNQGWL